MWYWYVRLAKAHVRGASIRHSAASDQTHAICRMKSISCADAVTRRQSDTAAAGEPLARQDEGHSAVVGSDVGHDGGTPTNP